MKYKFKKGDRVRIKPEVDLNRISIIGDGLHKELKGKTLTVTNASPGCEGWDGDEVNNTPTYTVDIWRIPESFLIKV